MQSEQCSATVYHGENKLHFWWDHAYDRLVLDQHAKMDIHSATCSPLNSPQVNMLLHSEHYSVSQTTNLCSYFLKENSSQLNNCY